jgi:hypothetical protein
MSEIEPLQYVDLRSAIGSPRDSIGDSTISLVLLNSKEPKKLLNLQ